MNTRDEFNDQARNDAGKDPATLEREIDQTRAEMGRTLGALERKLSPGELLDEAMGFAREHAGEFAGNLGRSLKENPMPALLTAVGVVWMLASNNRPTSPRAYNYADRFEPRTDYDLSGSEEPGDDRTWSEAGQSAKRTATEAISGVGQRVRTAAESASEKISRSQEAVRTGIRRTSDSAQAQGQRMRENFGKLFDEQPLVVGALGIAIGAAIGAILPRTEQEDRLMGTVRDNAVSAVAAQGSKTYEQVRGTVSRLGEEAKQTTSESTDPLSKHEASGSLAEER